MSQERVARVHTRGRGSETRRPSECGKERISSSSCRIHVLTGGSAASARSVAAAASASTGGSAADARSAAAVASASTGGSAASARSAAAAAFASTVGSAANARIAAAAASASTGGGAANARSAAAVTSASTGGSAASARSAAAAASASTVGGAASARSAAAAVTTLWFSRRRRSKSSEWTRTQSRMSGSPQCNHTLSWLVPGRVAVSESVEEHDTYDGVLYCADGVYSSKGFLGAGRRECPTSRTENFCRVRKSHSYALSSATPNVSVLPPPPAPRAKSSRAIR